MNESTRRYLFAYGTLRRGARKDRIELVGGGARLVGSATVPGRLYDLGDYPGMLEAARPDDRVSGDLFELNEVEATLRRLDDYEDCGPGGFRRLLWSVRLDSGEELEAWLYLYQGTVSERQRIPSGDYLRGRHGPNRERPDCLH